MRELLIASIVLGLVTYRIGRFILLDSMIDGTRDRVYTWLNSVDKPSNFKLWVLDLMTCVYCLTIWIAAGAVTYWSLLIRDEWLGWSWPVVWLATATVALVPWAYIDSKD